MYLSVRQFSLAVVKSHTNCRDVLSIPGIIITINHMMSSTIPTCFLEFGEDLLKQIATIFDVRIIGGDIVPVMTE